MKQLGIILLFLILWIFPTHAQTALSGKVTDVDTGEELIGANVLVYQNGLLVTGISTDFNGKYTVSLDPGLYDVEITFIGFSTVKVTGVVIEDDQITPLDIGLLLSETWGCSYFVLTHTIPLIQIDKTASGLTLDQEQIKTGPAKRTNNLILNSPGISIPKF